MREAFHILDADRHVVEPYGLWRDYLEAKYRPDAPRAVPFFEAQNSASVMNKTWSAADLYPQLVVAGKPIYKQMSSRAWAEIVTAATSRPFRGPVDRGETHLAHMDAEGIDVAVLYPTYALLIEGVDSLAPGLAAALARAYNRWLADFVALAPKRLIAAGLISVHLPDEMLAELARVAELGFRAVVLRPNPVDGRRLSHQAYEPFWAECEARSMPVVIHEGTHAYLPTAGADRFTTRFAQHACSHPMEQMIALLDFIEGGVFERYPGLRVAFLEAGCGWVPYWLGRLDGEYAHLAREVEEHVRLAPSAYFQRQAWVAAEPDEPYLPRLLDFIGTDRILFGTDFPHVDHDDGLVSAAFARRPMLSDHALKNYLWDNGARFFALDAVSSSST